jgi:hypothetical protein
MQFKRSLSFFALTFANSFAAELPVKEVVLYKHGVGYFQREGELTAGEAARLDFRATEMNDVLKSLTVQERNGGKVSGLRYDSSEPLDQKLQNFPFTLTGEVPALSAFLNQLKGSRLELRVGQETVSGSIMGSRLISGDAKQSEREQLVLLLDAGEVRTFDLTIASSLKFTEPKLQAQLIDYLRLVSASRSTEKRSVYLDSTDDKKRSLVASYMIPTPVWKSSYRLLFKEDGEPLLEGWAIVDNTTGEDWDKVRLSLVSGRPISFISRLYEPKYVNRPEAELAEDRAQRPVVYEGVVGGVPGGLSGGMLGGIVANNAAPRAPRSMAKSAPMPAQMDAMKESRSVETVMVNESNIVQSAAGRDLGDLFEYRFSTPVTVKKSESAMLPFLQQKIATRKLLIYSDLSAKNPMNAAELTNTTGKTLDGGPITVFDANAYAGEALVETVKAGDKRLISYAIDLGTSEVGIREVHANRGVLTVRSARRETKTFTIHNVDPRAKTLIIEHPVRSGYKFLNQKPTETTSSAYRFEVKLGARSTDKFPLTEEFEYDNSTVLSNLTPDQIVMYIRNKSLSDAAKRQMQGIADLKRQIADTDDELKRSELDASNLTRDQDRIRQNINSLRQVAGQMDQVQKYAAALASQESQLAALRDKSSALQQKKFTLQAELNSLFEKIEF